MLRVFEASTGRNLVFYVVLVPPQALSLVVYAVFEAPRARNLVFYLVLVASRR